MKIILIGYMGSGKTAVGKLLATKLNIPYIDLDQEIEKRDNLSISEIFNSKGAIYFRKKERIVLLELLEDENPMVLSTGGGTPCYGDVMEILTKNESYCCVYLSANVPTLSNRLFKEKEHRPLLAAIDTKESLNEFIGKHLFERTPFYQQAPINIATDTLTIEETIARILKKIPYSK